MTHAKPLLSAGNWVQGEITRLEGVRGDLVVQREQEYAALTATDDDLDHVETLLAELEQLRGRC